MHTADGDAAGETQQWWMCQRRCLASVPSLLRCDLGALWKVYRARAVHPCVLASHTGCSLFVCFALFFHFCVEPLPPISLLPLLPPSPGSSLVEVQERMQQHEFM